MGEKRLPLAVRFDANPPSTQTVKATVRKGNASTEVAYRLLSLPLYLVERVAQLSVAALEEL